MSSAVTAVKPTHSSVYTSTPTAPPRTQANCSVDSERPNPDARDSSGRSFCNEASREAFAIALAPDVTKVAIAASIRLPPTEAANATALTASVQRTTSAAGRPSFKRALVKLPTKLPMPAAAPITPRMAICAHPPASCALATNAGYKNRNPTMTLMVQLPHSDVMMLRPKGCRSVAVAFLGTFLNSSGQLRRRGSLSWR